MKNVHMNNGLRAVPKVHFAFHQRYVSQHANGIIDVLELLDVRLARNNRLDDFSFVLLLAAGVSIGEIIGQELFKSRAVAMNQSLFQAVHSREYFGFRISGARAGK